MAQAHYQRAWMSAIQCCNESKPPYRHTQLRKTKLLCKFLTIEIAY